MPNTPFGRMLGRDVLYQYANKGDWKRYRRCVAANQTEFALEAIGDACEFVLLEHGFTAPLDATLSELYDAVRKFLFIEHPEETDRWVEFVLERFVLEDGAFRSFPDDPCEETGEQHSRSEQNLAGTTAQVNHGG